MRCWRRARTAPRPSRVASSSGWFSCLVVSWWMEGLAVSLRLLAAQPEGVEDVLFLLHRREREALVLHRVAVIGLHVEARQRGLEGRQFHRLLEGVVQEGLDLRMRAFGRDQAPGRGLDD